MCAIIGSFNLKTLVDLIDLNKNRGVFSHSYTWVDPHKGVQLIQKKLGIPNKEEILKTTAPQGTYFLMHLQAPTGGALATETLTTIHPAEYEGNFLYHNGLLLRKQVKKLQQELVFTPKELESKSMYNWDTALMLKFLVSKGDSRRMVSS